MCLKSCVLTIACLCAYPSLADQTHQPYAGFDTRGIASLSAEDIADLENGRGWGLALPAELNGYPGPTHVLELAKALDLTDDQRSQIEVVFEEMRQEAIAYGAAFIAAEQALDQAFADGSVTVTSLRELTQAAADARGKLRFVHLSRHLQTLAVLSDAQVARYATLRGYGADACASVPDGHNAEMWRRHNGCTD